MFSARGQEEEYDVAAHRTQLEISGQADECDAAMHCNSSQVFTEIPGSEIRGVARFGHIDRHSETAQLTTRRVVQLAVSPPIPPDARVRLRPRIATSSFGEIAD
jgi:hypothetical protein